jgi:hypothetical protein
MNIYSEKLNTLADFEGFSNSDELLANAIFESVVPGICMNKGCNATYNYEPDQRNGYCDECQTRTVESCLSLAGVI